MTDTKSCDFLVIGGGFYGCALALYLRSISSRVVLVEAGDVLLDRASRVNQARVHTGFHYPRSVLTAAKSMALHRRFAADFPDAIVDDFQMIYAVARQGSKVSAKRFHRMFADMGAPIAPATPSQTALFDPARIEAAFACTEHAFDYTVLRAQMAAKLAAAGIDLRLGAAVVAVQDRADDAVVTLANGDVITATFAFNVTYARINAVLGMAGLPQAALKHEIAEIALVRPPPDLAGYGITIMDGPFLSVMPYPAENLYSLTHVRYTPHATWVDRAGAPSPDDVLAGFDLRSRHRHMILDGARYLPCLREAEWVRSIHDIKTVLMKNEGDDGRPILYQRTPAASRVVSILGGKIDNIYDLFDLVKTTDPAFARADARFLHDNADARFVHGMAEVL